MPFRYIPPTRPVPCTAAKAVQAGNGIRAELGDDAGIAMLLPDGVKLLLQLVQPKIKLAALHVPAVVAVHTDDIGEGVPFGWTTASSRVPAAFNAQMCRIGQ
jgi:hypothetical protein